MSNKREFVLTEDNFEELLEKVIKPALEEKFENNAVDVLVGKLEYHDFTLELKAFLNK